MTFDAGGNLIETDDGGVYRRTSPRSNTGDWFGISVAMDGDTAVIGARADSDAGLYAGAAYVFERTGG